MINSIIKWFAPFFSKQYTGTLPDTRFKDEKQKDYLHEERASISDPVWGNAPIENMPYANRVQFSTSSCVAHASIMSFQIAVFKATGEWIEFSRAFLYRLRSTYPGEGMNIHDAFEIPRKTGLCLFTTLPTPSTEEEINRVVITNAMKTEALNNKGLEYYRFANHNDIDKLATAASEGFASVIFIYASFKDWSKKYPTTFDKVSLGSAPIQHGVTILDKSGFIKDGVKYVTIVDSSPFGGFELRHLSEEFIKQRVYAAGYWKSTTLKEGVTEKPKHEYKVPMKIEDRSEEVRWLQKALAYEGFLPADCITGYFGGRTLSAVKTYQLAHKDEILAPIGLINPTGMVYNATLASLNKRYA